MGDNEEGETAVTAATPTAATAAGNHKFTGMGSVVWSLLTDSVKSFGPEATPQEFSMNFLKWKADVGGESTKCATFKTKV